MIKLYIACAALALAATTAHAQASSSTTMTIAPVVGAPFTYHQSIAPTATSTFINQTVAPGAGSGLAPNLGAATYNTPGNPGVTGYSGATAIPSGKAVKPARKTRQAPHRATNSSNKQ